MQSIAKARNRHIHSNEGLGDALQVMKPLHEEDEDAGATCTFTETGNTAQVAPPWTRGADGAGALRVQGTWTGANNTSFGVSCFGNPKS